MNLSFVQNCWVVPDIDEAMRRWIGMGVGPFFRHDSCYPDAIYRGSNVPLSFKVALAQAGSIQIELIEQTSSGPSAYRDSVPQGATGFHHMCRIVDDVAAEAALLRARGCELANEFQSSGIQVIYADTRRELGCMLELVPSAPVIAKLRRIVADAADGWDGSNPVRALDLGS